MSLDDAQVTSSEEPSEVPAAAPQRTRLVTAWLLVGVPLAYGISQTVKSLLPLFGH